MSQDKTTGLVPLSDVAYDEPDKDRTGIVQFDGLAEFEASEHLTKPIASTFRLLCVAGPHLGRAYRLGPGLGEVLIGRGDVQVKLDAIDVSRTHARVWIEADGFVVEDLGSVNGTLVNGKRIAASASLNVGDRIQLGSTILVLTHHDELEGRMHQLLRLDAMGAAVSGLAHDFNNALQVIIAGLDELERDLPARASPAMNDVKIAAGAAVNLASRLINFGRSEPPATQLIRLAPLTSEVVAMARRVVGDGISFTVNIPPEVAIQASREEMQQVLLNLCLNARDAMPAGGRISIGARLVTCDHATAVAQYLPSKGDYVELEFTDTGIGMDEATLARAFEPFFTTKAPGKGTGLGLAMAHTVVRRHGGSMLAESSPGRGTTFRICLPRAVVKGA